MSKTITNGPRTSLRALKPKGTAAKKASSSELDKLEGTTVRDELRKAHADGRDLRTGASRRRDLYARKP